MILSREHKFIFVHPYKVGGSSVSEALLNNVDCVRVTPAHLKVRDIYKPNDIYLRQQLQDVDLTKMFIFSFVRNPWDRLVSWHTHLREVWPKKSREPGPAYRPALEYNFNDFIIKFVGGRFRFGKVGNGYDVNQYNFLTMPGKILRADFIGRTENLQEDFNKVCDQLGIVQIELERINVTENRRCDYREYYTEETKDVVANVYEKDITYFNYSFDNGVH